MSAVQLRSLLEICNQLPKEKKASIPSYVQIDETISSLVADILNCGQFRERTRLLLSQQKPEEIVETLELKKFWPDTECSAVAAEKVVKWVKTNSHQLDLGRLDLRMLPDTLFNSALPLVYFSCSFNGITQLPDTLGHCLDLEELSCDHNGLRDFPETLENCPLRTIHFSYNWFETIPPQLEHYKDLKLVMLDANVIGLKLPDWLTKLPDLQVECGPDAIAPPYLEDRIYRTLFHRFTNGYQFPWLPHDLEREVEKAMGLPEIRGPHEI